MKKELQNLKSINNFRWLQMFFRRPILLFPIYSLISKHHGLGDGARRGEAKSVVLHRCGWKTGVFFGNKLTNRTQTLSWQPLLGWVGSVSRPYASHCLSSVTNFHGIHETAFKIWNKITNFTCLIHDLVLTLSCDKSIVVPWCKIHC